MTVPLAKKRSREKSRYSQILTFQPPSEINMQHEMCNYKPTFSKSIKSLPKITPFLFQRFVVFVDLQEELLV